jgi:signal transduction histidine kinase
LWILVDNAVAHTADGGNVWVAVTGSGSSVTLQVADDGAGIPPGLQERIFDRFFRADESRGRSGGSGLGLSIARSIALSHGGTLVARRHPAGGAAFVATLPAVSSDS